jgi:hypothetical protein
VLKAHGADKAEVKCETVKVVAVGYHHRVAVSNCDKVGTLDLSRTRSPRIGFIPVTWSLPTSSA